MATIKISQSEMKVREPASLDASGLLIPQSVAKNIGDSYRAIGSIFDDIHKEQAAIEDQRNVQEIVKVVAQDISSISSGAKRNTDVKFAVETFDKLTKYDKYDNLIKDKTPRVKRLFKEWLSKTKTSEYTEIADAVNKKFVTDKKQSDQTHLNDLTIKAASTNAAKAQSAQNEIRSWFGKIENKSLYDDVEWKKLEDQTKKDVEKFRNITFAQNHPDYVIENYNEIKNKVKKGEAEKLLEIAKTSSIAQLDAKLKKEEFFENLKQEKSIQTFANVVQRLNNLKNLDQVDNLPTLDLITEIHKAGEINSAQYEALLRFYNDKNAATDDDIYKLINSQLYMLETVDDIDAFQKQVNVTAEYLLGLGINDFDTINSILDKAKDRQVLQDLKYYGNKIETILGKVNSGYLKSFGADEKKDQQLIQNGQRLYNEYIKDGLSPEQAFIRMTKGYLTQRDKMPTIFDVNQVTSINIGTLGESDKKKSAAEIFNGWRNQVAAKYKSNSITIQEFKRDLASLEVMEQVHAVRAELGKAVNNNDFAFSENNSLGAGTLKLDASK